MRRLMRHSRLAASKRCSARLQDWGEFWHRYFVNLGLSAATGIVRIVHPSRRDRLGLGRIAHRDCYYRAMYKQAISARRAIVATIAVATFSQQLTSVANAACNGEVTFVGHVAAWRDRRAADRSAIADHDFKVPVPSERRS